MQRYVLLYDEDCGFCRWMLGKLLAWDRHRRLELMPLQDPESDRLLGGIEQQSKMESWHLVLPTGDVRSGGAAFAPLLRLLPGGRPLAALADTSPSAMARIYRWGADRRSFFGRRLHPRAVERADRRIALRRAGERSVRGHRSELA